MVTEISISENFLEEYLPRATIEILINVVCCVGRVEIQIEI